MASSTALALVLAACCIALTFLIRNYAYPRPLPGIPYHHESANRILGDIPGLIVHFRKHQTRTDWVAQQCVELDSPIVQLFLKPFGRPFVVIADHWEGEDILARRFLEFDRSRIMGDLFGGVVPNATIVQSSDHVFKSKRKLWSDTMSLGFQHDVVAPLVQTAAQDLCAVIRQKVRLTKEHPFEIGGDVSAAVFDSVWATFVGEDGGVNKASNRFLSDLISIDLPADMDEGVEMPASPMPLIFKAIQTISNGLHALPSSPFPNLHGRILPYLPSQRSAYALKDELILDRIAKGRTRHANGVHSVGGMKSGLDIIASKEAAVATREGRPIKHKEDLELRDEIVSFVIAGYETTAAVLTTGLKWLADNPRWQSGLRDILRSSLPTHPTAQEILGIRSPQLDATMEEMLRCADVGGAYSRVAKVNSVILGCSIPKGTIIWCMANGPSYKGPAFSINDDLRSAGALARKKTQQSWDSDDLGVFRAERWLVGGHNKELEFDPRAGPSLP